MAFVAWLTGLPGAGKTSIAQELVRIMNERGVRARHIQLDEIRRLIIPEPRYTEEERDIVYRAFALIAKLLCENGVNVVLDATGHRRRWRDFARSLIQDFFEVYVRCPVETCIRRETARESDLVKQRIYLNALDRLKSGRKVSGLGEVPGVDVPYEESRNPEIVVESDRLSPIESALRILSKLEPGR